MLVLSSRKSMTFLLRFFFILLTLLLSLSLGYMLIYRILPLALAVMKSIERIVLVAVAVVLLILSALQFHASALKTWNIPTLNTCGCRDLRPHRLLRSVKSIYFAVVYNPPSPPVQNDLVSYLSDSVDFIRGQYPDCSIIVLADSFVVSPLVCSLISREFTSGLLTLTCV